MMCEKWKLKYPVYWYCYTVQTPAIRINSKIFGSYWLLALVFFISCRRNHRIEIIEMTLDYYCSTVVQFESTKTRTHAYLRQHPFRIQWWDIWLSFARYVYVKMALLFVCLFVCVYAWWYLSPPSTIFQLYRGGQFYWWLWNSYNSTYRWKWKRLPTCYMTLQHILIDILCHLSSKKGMMSSNTPFLTFVCLCFVVFSFLVLFLFLYGCILVKSVLF